MSSRLYRQRWFGSVTAACLSLAVPFSTNFSAATPAWGAEDPGSEKSAAEILKGFELQIGDEPLEEFVPANPTPDFEAQRREAVALYMRGRIEQENGKFSKAVDSYLAAAEKNPSALTPYKAALPILLQRREQDRAEKLCLEAVHHHPRGYELTSAMAAVLVRQNQIDNAKSILSKSLETGNFPAGSLPDTMLRRDLGLYNRLQGDFNTASGYYETVFQAVTGDSLTAEQKQKILIEPGQLYDEFGDTFLKAQKPDLALKAFDQANLHRESKPGIHSYNLANVFHQTGQSEQALTELDKYFQAKLQTAGRAAYQLLKDLLKETGRENELIEKLQEMQAHDSSNDGLKYFYADTMLDSGDFEKAGELYGISQPSPSDPRALTGLIRIYQKNEDLPKLLDALVKTFSSIPRNVSADDAKSLSPDVLSVTSRFDDAIKSVLADDALFSKLVEYGRSLETDAEKPLDFLQSYVLAKLSSEKEAYTECEHFYRYAITVRTDPPALLYTELAHAMIEAQNYEASSKILQEALAHTSPSVSRERWRILYILSYAYEFQGKTAEAISVIKEAQRLQPTIPELQYQEGWIVYHARRWDDAIALFEQVISKHANDPDLITRCRFHISNIYVEKGDMERGIQILEDVLKTDPENIQANNDLGYLFADQGKHLERAEAMIRKAVTAEPENSAYLDSLGWVLYRKENYEEALGYLEQARSKKHGEDTTIFDHIGDCLEKLGRHEEAIANWKQALEKEEAKKVPSPKLLTEIRTKLGLPVATEPSVAKATSETQASSPVTPEAAPAEEPATEVPVTEAPAEAEAPAAGETP